MKIIRHWSIKRAGVKPITIIFFLIFAGSIKIFSIAVFVSTVNIALVA